ncbi:hypothetical protein [Bdellovibrio reynosensis]|uniref:Uncharacterized protein n=1 Tax=Bdellovibrio reynosensis TaxID=2835041 RepID=A0ABY4C4X0_9BACT|nr:hypothetical protein [Bdellovibrio reynosensis]UOF00006.1 hypothetical protein MNR06_09865 [Bdellovibrio reynosensis]
MRYFVFVLTLLCALWSFESQAFAEPAGNDVKTINLKIRPLSSGQYEYSYVWNDLTEEAHLRIGLVVESIDTVLKEKTISFASAKELTLTALDAPKWVEGCSKVHSWQFEYQPGLPNYLMHLNLKGRNCKWVAEVFDILQIRLEFRGVSVDDAVPFDVNANISR